MNEIIYPPCKKCGASHGMGWEEMETGKITPIDICRNWLFPPTIFSPHLNEEDFDKWKATLKDKE